MSGNVPEGKAKRTAVNVLMSKAIGLAGLLNYQDGAVVSKTVISKKTGTVTVFAFDKGQGLSTHSAPFDALVQILEGEARITRGPVEGESRDRKVFNLSWTWKRGGLRSLWGEW